MKRRSMIRLLGLATLTCTVSGARAQFAAPSSPAHTDVIPASDLIQPDALNTMLTTPDAVKPLILQIGSRVFFAEAHIPGSQYAGAASQPAGLEMLQKTVAALPKDKFIVLYCGCCPWARCPNAGAAYKRMHELGFTNVKVLYLANNFGDDWVRKGYSSASSASAK